MFVSVSAILCEVVLLLILACKIVRGFARLVCSLSIKGEGYKAVIAYKGEAGPSWGCSYYAKGFADKGLYSCKNSLYL